MNLKISYRHLESTPSIEEKIREKANHLHKFFKGEIDVRWVCSVEKGYHRSEVRVNAGRNHFNAEAKDDNLYKTMDEVLGKLEKQIRKKNDIIKSKIHR